MLDQRLILLSHTEEQRRCPHLVIIRGDIYCGKGLDDKAEVSETRRFACSTISSLRKYCLSRFAGCLLYRDDMALQ